MWDNPSLFAKNIYVRKQERNSQNLYTPNGNGYGFRMLNNPQGFAKAFTARTANFQNGFFSPIDYHRKVSMHQPVYQELENEMNKFHYGNIQRQANELVTQPTANYNLKQQQQQQQKQQQMLKKQQQLQITLQQRELQQKQYQKYQMQLQLWQRQRQHQQQREQYNPQTFLQSWLQKPLYLANLISKHGHNQHKEKWKHHRHGKIHHKKRTTCPSHCPAVCAPSCIRGCCRLKREILE